ncbi:hypothetical protein BKA70DRAFT_6215 [Coprinopsis sp. MPI-PUGE-AT-0042]|nr:hypothetical protein BKA70DRAFT_6215 [Coprinopsis sp. MPI-PUGE-AT-0042]
MTEYDYSPAAYERYMETQDRIDRWRRKAEEQGPCNAFAPTTPHIEFLELTDREEREQRHRYDPKYIYASELAQSKKVPARPSPRKDRRYSYDQYGRDMDKKYRSDTEEEDYAAKSKSRTRRHRDSHASISHVSAVSRHHERSSSRQESHVSSSRQESHVSSRDRREEKYRPATPARQRELSTSSREKDRSDSEYRSSSRASHTTPATSRSQSRQSNIVGTGQGYVLVEKEQPRPRTAHNTPTATRATTPTSAKVPSSRPRAISHATPTSAGVTSPTKSIHSRSTAVPTVSITTQPTTRPRGASRSQVSPVLTLDLPPFGQPHVIGNDYAGYPVSRPSAATTTSAGVYPYPQQQAGPTSAPPLARNSTTPTPPTYNPATAAPKPTRSQTTPGYDGRNSYDSSYSWQGNLPTHPHSGAVTPTKGSTSLLKRMFTGLTLGKSSGRSSPKYPFPKESQGPVRESGGGKRIVRKRSSSF